MLIKALHRLNKDLCLELIRSEVQGVRYRGSVPSHLLNGSAHCQQLLTTDDEATGHLMLALKTRQCHIHIGKTKEEIYGFSRMCHCNGDSCKREVSTICWEMPRQSHFPAGEDSEVAAAHTGWCPLGLHGSALYRSKVLRAQRVSFTGW